MELTELYAAAKQSTFYEFRAEIDKRMNNVPKTVKSDFKYKLITTNKQPIEKLLFKD